MTQRTYTQITGMFFGLIALLHIFRFLQGWEATIGGWQVPLWLSVVGVVVTGFLAWSAWKLSK